MASDKRMTNAFIHLFIEHLVGSGIINRAKDTLLIK